MFTHNDWVEQLEHKLAKNHLRDYGESLMGDISALPGGSQIADLGVEIAQRRFKVNPVIFKNAICLLKAKRYFIQQAWEVQKTQRRDIYMKRRHWKSTGILRLKKPTLGLAA